MLRSLLANGLRYVADRIEPEAPLDIDWTRVHLWEREQSMGHQASAPRAPDPSADLVARAVAKAMAPCTCGPGPGERGYVPLSCPRHEGVARA